MLQQQIRTVQTANNIKETKTGLIFEHQININTKVSKISRTCVIV